MRSERFFEALCRFVFFFLKSISKADAAEKIEDRVGNLVTFGAASG
jgi:hypothetical protein